MIFCGKFEQKCYPRNVEMIITHVVPRDKQILPLSQSQFFYLTVVAESIIIIWFRALHLKL